MSYILDALKKSEAERNRSGAPSLLTIRHVNTGSGIAIWVWLVAALIVNACLGGFWLFWRSEPTQAIAIETAAIPAPAAARLQPTIEAPVAVRPSSAIPADPPRTRTDSTTQTSDLADLVFSSHVYADDPTMRAVTLNGRRLLEGDTISNGVQLKEITETGVILDINGRNVPLDVLQDWR